MKSHDTHPDRETLLEAVRTGIVPFSDHLRTCRMCRDIYQHLTELHQAGRGAMEEPSSDAVASWAAIPLLDSEPTRPVRHHGSISFDSWAEAGAVAIRDISIGDVRRLVLTAGSISFEIVAERLQQGWECVARVYDKGNVTSGFVLRVGRRRLLASTQSFYHWTSKQGPRGIALLSSGREVEFENPSWL